MRRLDSLTGLRFLAALAVFAWHVQPVLTGWQLRAVRPGPLGVSFFFVLSGFVLAWSHPQGQASVPFWRNRFARVYPNHVVAVAVTVLLLHTGLSKALAAQIPLLQAWVPRSDIYFGALSVDWSLSCEVLFYASFPFLLPLVQRLGWRLVAPVLTGAALLDVVALLIRPAANAATPVGLDYWTYIFPPVRLAEFVVGILAAELVRSQRVRIPVGPATALVVVALGAVAWLPTPMDLGALAAVPFALLMVAVAQLDLAGRRSWLAFRPLVILGEWSFAFYLVHTIVLRKLLVHTTSPAAVVLVGLVGSVVGAGLLHRIVERPYERRLRVKRDRLSVPD